LGQNFRSQAGAWERGKAKDTRALSPPASIPLCGLGGGRGGGQGFFVSIPGPPPTHPSLWPDDAPCLHLGFQDGEHVGDLAHGQAVPDLIVIEAGAAHQ